MNKFYVYLFMRDDFYSPYYVGKGQGRRCFQHDKTRCANSPNKNRIIKIKTEMSEEDALELESKLILFWGRKEDGGVLQNKQEGGKQPPNWTGKNHSVETKNKISETRKKLMREGKIKVSNNLPTPPVVVFQGKTYPNRKVAAAALGISVATLDRRRKE